MTSITLRLCKSDNDFTQKASKKITDDKGGEWFVVPLFFKKIHDGLFVEYTQQDLPQNVENKINETEKSY